MTGYYEEFAAVATRTAGFNAYLTKPLNFEALCVLVEHVAGLKRLRGDSAA